MKRTRLYVPLLLVFCSVAVARAQGPYNFALSFSGAQDKSNGLAYENIYSANPFGLCTPSTSDPTCQPTPALGHFFMGFSADAMLSKRFGFGGGFEFQPTKGNYGPLQYRQEFYDFNGIYAPINNKRLTLRIEGGIGGAHTGFSVLQTECVGSVVCSSSATSFGGANHFQEHVGVGIQIPLTRYIFLRPQLEFRHVGGFTDQFGKDGVPEGIIYIGYNFGSYE